MDKIADRAEQNAVIKQSRAETNDGFAGFERIVSDAESRSEIIVIFNCRFSFVAQSVTDCQIRNRFKFVVGENSPISVFHRYIRAEILPEA